LISHRINGERVVLLAWPRAILLQMAHPLIAAGVAEHSEFRGSALGAARRLRHTVRAMLDLAFGGPQAAEATIERILAIHRRVHGTLREPVGLFPAGHPYSAEDPDLVLWVHATLVESVVQVYERLVATLPDADRDRYCAESAPVAIALGARPGEVPRTWRALTGYMARVHASGVLVVGRDARAIGGAILYPPPRLLTAPFGWMSRAITRGLLPDDIRRQYGLTWSRWRARQYAVVIGLVRVARRVLPFGWSRWREARAVQPSPSRPAPASPHAR
jgi:uncharacterized protein (DUF2236 family)